MNKRKLGKTGILVNPLGFGGIPIQRVTDSEAVSIVHTALEKGINFYDTARGYTCSEKYLGNSLQGKRENYYLATKSMSRTYEEMKKDIQISLENLQTPYIDLYQLHNLKSFEDLDVVMSENGAYRALKEAVNVGIVKHIGITSHSYTFLNSLLDGKYKDSFETIQFPYNFLELDAQKLFEKASKMNIGTIAMKPLGGGYIANTDVAIKFLLADENLSVLIPGMGSIDEVITNTSVLNDELVLSSEDHLYIRKVRDETKDDFCHRCGYCLPCTKGIDIPGVFTLENYFDRYGLKSWAETRYQNQKVLPSQCCECIKCVSKCPYGLDIPKRLKRIVKKFERD